MLTNCGCPKPTSLTTIPVSDCNENFGQIQKIAFQRIYKDDGTKNSFATLAAIQTLANWTALLTAEDSTKIVVSPYVEAPETEPGEPITFGGGNDTLDGIEEITGREPTTFTAQMRKLRQSIIKAMKELQCEEIAIYLFDGNGNIGALEGSETTPMYYPIPIRSLFVGDKDFGGLAEPDSNALQFAFPPNYSDDFVKVVPTFNPLTDLRPTV